MNNILAILTAVVNSLWQALAVAALVWLGIRFVPRTNAATRYAIWWATLGVVLVLPVPPRLILMPRSHPPPVAMTAVKTPTVVALPVIAEPVVVTVKPGRSARWPIAVFLVWAAILVCRLFQIVRSYFYLRSVKRRATVSPIPLPSIPRHAELLISPDIVSPMAVGFLRPAVVLPEPLLAELSEPEREHVLLHEAAHLARNDDWANLAMRILGGALALHPVAIWILRRIEREQEMACDDWVVARTGAARPYAASLAHLFELRRARHGEILASGIFGTRSRLGERIEMLLSRGRTFSPRASAVGVTASAVVLGTLALAGSLAPPWIAFAQQAARPSFEVASIKPNNSASGNSGIRFTPGRLTAENVPLRFLITWAYNVRLFQLSGGPGWIDSAKFDIAAKAEGNASPDQMRLMLQTLLEERFKLGLRHEMKEHALYALVPANTGLKLRESGADCAALAREDQGGRQSRGPCGAWFGNEHQITGTKISMAQFVESLSNVLDLPVIDKTGFARDFDVRLEWAADEHPDDAIGPVIFTALQEQLGLKLESQKGPLDTLVIDHVEKPDAN